MGKHVNDDSSANVLSTFTLAVNAWTELLAAEVPELQFVYSDDLSYEAVVARWRANQTEDAATTAPLFPLVGFKRSPMRWAKDAPGRRMVTQTVRQDGASATPGGATTKTYRAVHGEVDLQWRYYARNMDDLERFEVGYLSEEGVSGTKQLQMAVPDLSATPFPLILTWGPLDTFETTGSGANAVLALGGQVTLRSFWTVFVASAPHLLKIRARILSIQGIVMAQFNVPSP